MRVSIGFALCLFLLPATAQAAITTTGDVNPANPSTWTSSTTAYIGDLYDGTVTINSGSDINSYTATIGNLSNTEGAVSVDGNGSIWTNCSLFIVSNYGDGTLNITNGGWVYNNVCQIAKYGIGQVTVDGTGSRLINTYYLDVGIQGALTQNDIQKGTLEIKNGGRVANTYGRIAYNSASTGEVFVEGTGSTWVNSETLSVGRAGTGVNSATGIGGLLEITDGGTVSNTDGYIGELTGAIGKVLVEDDSSTWTNNNDLYVGKSGTGTLDINNGGTVINQNGYIACTDTSKSNGTVTVGGSGTEATWINNNHLYVNDDQLSSSTISGELNINNQGTVTAGGLSIGANGTLNLAGGTLELTGDMNFYDWDGTFNFTSGTIKVSSDGASSADVTVPTGSFVGPYGTNLSSGKALVVTGPNSSWDESEYHINVSDGNLTIEDGGSVSSYYGLIGSGSAGSEAVATVDGTDSVWTINGRTYLGYNDNTTGELNITNGGRVNNTVVNAASYIGNNTGSTGIATVDGNGSSWTNVSNLRVGLNGNGTLNITNGGLVTNAEGRIGFYSGSTGTVTVSGTDSTWTNSGNLYVGHQGTGTMNVTNGGSVSNATGMVGEGVGSTGTVNVDGIGSTWTNNFLLVGCSGDGTLNITNGGQVSNTFGCVISSSSGSTGMVNVDGDGSILNNSSAFAIGALSTGELNITNGGQVINNTDANIVGGATWAGTVNVGEIDSTSPNVATWTNSGALSVGTNGTGTLNIYRQGKVSTSDLSIGTNGTLNLNGGTLELTDDMNFYDWDGTFNFTSGEIKVSNGATITPQAAITLSCGKALTVTGSGSSWDSGNYDFTNSGGGLAIENGGAISSASAFIYGDSPNSLDDSTWALSGTLHVGYTRTGYLNVTNGSNLSCANAYIASAGAIATGYVGIGSGSTWTNSGNLYVGHAGPGTLCITDGGTVSNVNSYIGGGYWEAVVPRGTVTVDGSGSTWTNSGDILIGYRGTGTLNITNGGSVSNVNGIIGDGSRSADTVNVGEIDSTSPNVATWTNSGALTVGNNGTGVLNIYDQGLVSANDLSIGASGTLTLNGGTLEITGDMDFYAWNGTFNFTSGTIKVFSDGASSADVTVPTGSFVGPYGTNLGSGKALVVTGPNSSWDESEYYLNVSNGNLTIEDGGSVSSYYGFIGNGSGSEAVATVDGADSVWTISGKTYLGYNDNATGELNITNGGRVNNTGVSMASYIGVYVGSTGVATVDGTNSMWTNACSIAVGLQGDGELNITNGGLVTSTAGLLGYYSGSTGLVNVSGTDSTWTNSSNFYVGYQGTGSMNITNGGSVSNATGIIGDEVGSTGTVTVSGANSTWENSGNLIVGDDGTGTLNIFDGGLVCVDGTLTIGVGNEINMETGGMLALLGDWDASLATFLDEISGTGIIQYDPLDTIGNDNWVTLEGTTSTSYYNLNYYDSGDWNGYTVLEIGTAPTPPPSFSVVPSVPEPSTVALILTAMMAVGVIRRRGGK